MPQSNKKIVLVCGSADVTYLPNIFSANEIGCIVNIGENNVDLLSTQWAKENKIEYVCFECNYKTFLDDAPQERDKQAVNFCDEIIMLWKTPEDRLIRIGKYAKRIGRKIHLCYIEGE